MVGDGKDDVRGALKEMSSSLRSLLLGGSIMATGDDVMVKLDRIDGAARRRREFGKDGQTIAPDARAYACARAYPVNASQTKQFP